MSGLEYRPGFQYNFQARSDLTVLIEAESEIQSGLQKSAQLVSLLCKRLCIVY